MQHSPNARHDVALYKITPNRFVYTFFFQGSAEMTERKDGGGPDVILQVMCTEPGLKKKRIWQKQLSHYDDDDD
ncbi:MAG: hypothetical protein FRX49_05398 [Trebouxia sp. A1-2]|nr:MAG: hypothetical protein FRX49_05398 [Trebouxia sp. A1-2]